MLQPFSCLQTLHLTQYSIIGEYPRKDRLSEKRSASSFARKANFEIASADVIMLQTLYLTQYCIAGMANTRDSETDCQRNIWQNPLQEKPILK